MACGAINTKELISQAIKGATVLLYQIAHTKTIAHLNHLSNYALGCDLRPLKHVHHAL